MGIEMTRPSDQLLDGYVDLLYWNLHQLLYVNALRDVFFHFLDSAHVYYIITRLFIL